MLQKHSTKHSQLALLAFVLALANPVFAQSYPNVTVFAVAHEDDWQLLMNPNPYDDVNALSGGQPAAKVVFIYLTAGNANRGADQYFIAREEGAKRGVKFMADAHSAPASAVWSTVTVNGRALKKHTYKNTVSYFLRLPDGGFAGAGFANSNYQSLEKLRTGVSSISAIDGSATYSTWYDLWSTLQQIVQAELSNSGASNAWLNIPDSDSASNPGDHSDHVNTGRAMDNILLGMPCLNVARFVGYDVINRAPNLPGSGMVDKAGTYAATSVGISDNAEYGSWDSAHKQYLDRTYFRTTLGNGSICF